MHSHEQEPMEALASPVASTASNRGGRKADDAWVPRAESGVEASEDGTASTASRRVGGAADRKAAAPASYTANKDKAKASVKRFWCGATT